jgi:D-alanine-D-alanine ligase
MDLVAGRGKLMSEFGKVAVLMGGPSSEREISFLSGNAVLAALKSQGIDACAFDPANEPLLDLRRQGVDRVFIALHGRFGEDGTVQGALEVLGLPYTGSGVMASALAMDKWRTKLVWIASDIPTPRFRVVDATTDWWGVVAELGLPLIVKPAREGSTIGISKVRSVDHGELAGAYHNKYFSDATRYSCPSGIDAAVEAQIQAQSLQAFRLVGCTGWGRLDLILRADGAWKFLEVNTSPGMTGHSLVPMAAKQAGMSFADLCVAILRGAHVG